MISLESARFPYSLEVVENTSDAGTRTPPTYGGRLASRKDHDAKERVVRKFQGILLGFTGDEALVVFKSGNESFEYYLSAPLLKRNGVTVIDQPFEFIEGERVMSGPQVELFTRVVPLAPANSATSSGLALPPETRAKLQAIFAQLRTER
jgi:hypothetical protein